MFFINISVFPESALVQLKLFSLLRCPLFTILGPPGMFPGGANLEMAA